jgi:DNA polymerase-3 subunit delta
MLGGHRVIWIDAQSRDLARFLEPIIAHPPKDCWIIVEAGNLKRGAVLRTAVDRAANALSIECYPDERRAVITLIEAEAREAGVEVTREARESLLSLLGQDRLTTRGEIAKLMIYVAGSRRIELRDVEAIVTDAAASVLSELIDQLLLGQTTEVERPAARFFAAGGDPGLLILRLVSQLASLQNLQAEVEAGVSLERTLQEHFTKLPTGVRMSLARQAERWTLCAMKNKLPIVQKTSARVRRGGRLGASLSMRVLLALTASSRTDPE